MGGLRYGFGLARDTMAGHGLITHGGGINGFVTENLWMPDLSMSVTVLANAGGAGASRLTGQVVRAVRYYGNATWGLDFDLDLRLIFAIENGRAAKLTLRQGGREFPGPRKP